MDIHLREIIMLQSCCLKFGIELLIFPGHTSHVLQPFDVGIGSILKCAFKRLLLNCKLKIEEEEDIVMTNMSSVKTKEIRNIMIVCFKMALDEVCTTANLRQSFKDAGIVPISKEKPLSSQYTFNSGIYDGIRNSFLNNKCINYDIDALKSLFQYEFKHSGTDEELGLTLSKIKEIASGFHSTPLSAGRLLTKFPDIIYEHDGIIERIKLESH